MTRLLSLFGLMRVSEHERMLEEADGWLETTARDLHALEAEYKQAEAERDIWKNTAEHWGPKFKRAAADLAAQAEEIAGYRQALARAEHMMDQASERLSEIREERDALRPDAEAMRKKRYADRKRMAGKRNG